MERLLKAFDVLYASKKQSESAAPNSKRNDNYEKERGAFVDIREVLTHSEIRKDTCFNSQFSRVMELVFDFINHRNSDLRLIAEQTLDSILRYYISELSSSRVVVVLMSEIKRNGPARSLVAAISRFADAVRHVKPNRAGAVGLHFITALCSIARRPEEAVQSALEKYLPNIFAILGYQLSLQRTEATSSLYNLAVENLELSGTANRAASVIIWQLAQFIPSILKKAFKQLSKNLSLADDQNSRNMLVGSLNSLRLLWPLIVARKEDFELNALQNMVRDVLRCLFSSHNDVVVAALELLDRILGCSLSLLNPSSFFPQAAPCPVIDEDAGSLAIASPCAISQLSSLRASPIDSLFDVASPAPLELSDGSALLEPSENENTASEEVDASSVGEEEVLDPLRHQDVLDDLDVEKPSCSETSSEVHSTQAENTAIPARLPVNFCPSPFFTYTSVLLARRFLLSEQCLKQIPDRNVRVSHKILAMNCLAQLAVHMPNFFDIPLRPPLRLGEPSLKDIQLFMRHEDDLLKAATVTTIINGSRAAFRSFGCRFTRSSYPFKKCIEDAMRARRAQCSRALLCALKFANEVVYRLRMVDEICKFACENFNDNYFLLRVAVVDYLASVEWSKAASWSKSLPDEVLSTYLRLLADRDHRVRKSAAENLALLVRNANFGEFPNDFDVEQPSSFICSAFPCESLTIAMGPQYTFFNGLVDSVVAENLTVLLSKMFAMLTVAASDEEQAGFLAGLAGLASAYPPSRYSHAWCINAHRDPTRLGLLVSLINKCSCACSTVVTLVHLFEVVSYLFAGLNEVRVTKLLSEDSDITPTSLPKLPDAHIMEQLLLTPLRVLNLYYTLVTEHIQCSQMSSNSVFARPALSPVRKALPAGAAGSVTAEQRLHSISNLGGTNVRMTRNSSFLHSSTLAHLAEALRGAYVNYLGCIEEDTKEKFASLLIAALNNLSCILEMALFTHISSLIEELLLYCRVAVDIAPAETVRLVTQLFKIMFGKNAANISVSAIKKMHTASHGPPHDLLDAYLLRSANLFTEFIVNSGRIESFNAHLLRRTGWLRKDTVWKAHAPPSGMISPFIGAFEGFVSLTIRLYQSSNCHSLQIATLNLLCELVRGGINFSMLDPEVRLINFLISQVNEFGARNWNSSDAVNIKEINLLRSIFEFFSTLSHVESRGQMIMEPSKVLAFAEAVIKAAEAKPQLTLHALNCMQVALLDYIGVRMRFDFSLAKILSSAEALARSNPTEYIQLWTLVLLGSANSGDEQSWSKTSLAFFEILKEMNVEWGVETAFSAMLALRLCSSSTFRPVDTFFNKLLAILESDFSRSFQRLLYGSPYLFMFLCVLKVDEIMPRIEELCEAPLDKLARLMMNLLWECLSELRRLSVVENDAIGCDTERMAVWYLQALSFAIRSGNAKNLTSSFAKYIPDDIADLSDLSLLHPRLYVQILAFYSVLSLQQNPIFFGDYEQSMSDLCTLMRLRGGDVKDIAAAKDLVQRCTARQLLEISRQWSSSSFLSSLSAEESASLIELLIRRASKFSSAVCIADLANIIAFKKLSIPATSLKLLITEARTSFAVSQYAGPLFRTLPLKVPSPDSDETESLQLSMKDGEVWKSETHLFTDLEGAVSEKQQQDDSACFLLNSADPRTFGSDELTELLISLASYEENLVSSDCFSRVFSNFDASSGEQILRTAYAAGRFDIISSCIDELENMKVAAMSCGEMYMEYSVVCLQKAQNLCEICANLAFDPSVMSPLQFYAQSKLAERPDGAVGSNAGDWAKEPERFNHWMKRYADYLLVEPLPSLDLDAEGLNAVTFAVSRPSFIAAIEAAQNSQQIIDQQLTLAVRLARIIRILRMEPSKRSEYQDSIVCKPSEWDMIIHDRTGKKDFDIGFFTDAIETAFSAVLQIQEAFRKKTIKTHLYRPLERLAKALMRLPFLNDISCIPRLALLCKWQVGLEVHRTSISVPTVNIHYLSNVDVLREFNWRISWAGWNRRANFENVSMSLFGVLSSTPTGSELLNSSSNLVEQIMASTAAVEGLTNLLLESLLYPERGNPLSSRFIAKDRETSTEFITSSYGQRMCMLKAKLLGDHEPETIYWRNLEFLEDDGKVYKPGQLSLHAIWNMTGVLDLERSLYKQIPGYSAASPKRGIPSSNSAYLLESGHDSTNESCLRMLFDTYSHWFRVGINALPLSLLSATVKSMALLSDLFTDLDQYKFVFGHMKALFTLRSQTDYFDLGNVIYLLMKCVAVLGLEDMSLTKADAQKALFSWVECGLASDLSEVRIRTLQGILCLVQALNHEDLKAILHFVHSFLLSELQVRRPGVDPVNTSIELESCEYDTMLWSVGFFFCDNPFYSNENFKGAFFELVGEIFSSALTPLWIMNLLTSGMERLVISSRTYILSFNRIAISVLERYFTMPMKFVFSLRLIIACLYHGMHEGTVLRVGLEPYDPRLHLMEQHPTIFKILAEGAEEDVCMLLRVLPYLLIDSLNQSEIINSVLKELIHRYTDRPHPRPRAIFTIVHHWFSVLHSRETEAIVLDWTLNGLDSFKYVTDPTVFRFYVNCFLCSSAPNPNIANLFHIVASRKPEAAWLDKHWFRFTVHSLLIRLDAEAKNALKASMQRYVEDGVEYIDERRIENFPEF